MLAELAAVRNLLTRDDDDAQHDPDALLSLQPGGGVDARIGVKRLRVAQRPTQAAAAGWVFYLALQKI